MKHITPTEAFFTLALIWTVMYAVAQVVLFFN